MGKKKNQKKFKQLADEKKFLWLVADNVTPSDVLFISQLDYGHDKEKHAELITGFKDTLDTQNLEYWYPLEVWELNRWSTPGSEDLIGHGRRAFSCAGLMACYFDNVAMPIEFCDVTLPLFESLVRLNLIEWQNHFSDFLRKGLSETIEPEDRFSIQLTLFLTSLSNMKEKSALRSAYDQLMRDEMFMLKKHWEVNWKSAWHPGVAPKLERPAKIIDTYITHETATMFAAQYVDEKAKQLNDIELAKDLKTLARRIATLANYRTDADISNATICL